VRGMIEPARVVQATRWLMSLPESARRWAARRAHDRRFVEACRSEDLPLVATLLQADPSLAARSVSQSAVQAAIEGDHECVVGALLDATARSWFRAEMQMAVATGAIRSLALLLERGYAPNQRIWTGLSPLMFAARRGRLDMIEVLLAAGAQPAWRDTHGMTAADHATRNGHRAVVRALRRRAHDSEGAGDAA